MRVRRALLFYALRRLGLDVAPDARAPHQQHIVLLNRDEVDRMRRGPSAAEHYRFDDQTGGPLFLFDSDET